MKNNKIKFKIFFALVLLLSSSLVFFTSENSFAYEPKDLTKKALMQALQKCYAGGAMKDSFASAGKYAGPNSLYANEKVDKKLPLPTSINGDFHNINDNNLDCEDVILGWGGPGGGTIDSVFKYMGKAAPAAGASNVATWLKETAGYETSSGSSSGKCVKYVFNYFESDAVGRDKKNEGEKSTDLICADDIQGGKIKSTIYIKSDGGWNRTRGINYNAAGVQQTVDIFNVSTTDNVFKLAKGLKNSAVQFKEIPAQNVKWADFVKTVKDSLSETPMIHGPTGIGTVGYNGYYSKYSNASYKETKEISTGDTGAASFTLNKNKSHKTAIKNMWGDKDLNSKGIPTVTEQEKVRLYMYYMEKVFNATIDCDVTDDQASGNGYNPIHWYKSGEKNFSKCYVTKVNTKDKAVNTVESGLFKYSGNNNYDDVYNFLKDVDVELGDEDVVSDGSSDQGGDDSGDTETDPCYAGAGAMGWLLCPVINSLDGLLGWVYDKVENQFLKFHSDDIFGSGAVLDAWSKMQIIANIMFAGFFLFVIYSQITGVGISNYGIKKILPKLIVTALSINLSYILCVAAVDLSNILGVGLKAMLESGLGVSAGTGASTGSVVGSYAVGGITTVAAIGVALYLNPGLVVTFLLFLATCAISVIFLWLILVLREVIVILGVVIAPFAFVTCMLPNTEKIFKMWFDMMKAMLLLYPICSLVVGAGNFAGRVLSGIGSSNSDLSSTFNLAAMIAQVAPFFFIPSILKGSLKGLGTLSAKLAQGQRFVRGNTVDRARNSDLYKDYMLRRRAGLDKNGQLTKRGERMSKIPLVGRSTNAARSNYLSRKAQNDRLDRFSDKDYINATREAELDKEFDLETSNAMTMFSANGTDAKGLVDSISGNGGAKDIAAIKMLAQKNDYASLQEALAKINVAGLENRERSKLGQALVAMKGDDLLAGLYGKQLLKNGNFSFADYANGTAGNIKRDIQNVSGADIGALDDGVFKVDTSNGGTVNYSEILRKNMDDSQWSQLIASTGTMNGKNREAVNKHLVGEQVKTNASVFSGTSVEQVTSISDDTMQAIQDNGGSVQDIFESAKNDLEDPQNAQYVAKMSTAKKTNLNIGQKAASISVPDPSKPGTMKDIASKGHATYSVLGGTPGQTEHLTEGADGKFYKDDGKTTVNMANYRKL